MLVFFHVSWLSFIVRFTDYIYTVVAAAVACVALVAVFASAVFASCKFAISNWQHVCSHNVMLMFTFLLSWASSIKASERLQRRLIPKTGCCQ